ncbi:Small GTPase superfamily, Ras type [Cordyceps fumosorosea ARSEF 2679]|uniref:Small GTPase superfamily, Ras type n=1 Tax=Cordyceps fumosorosea (strain ARSEF 2679) TaxID=1081104 RepID=A0A168E3B7_CORFA|nr:Small GTPase superfamily, Ras type [Cordyceps fumosorosea ARSEF 2679]OAA73327.1 Small GTPase superfamily, Ras type [Cordyceps fumosorosea ARSEF 2679]
MASSYYQPGPPPPPPSQQYHATPTPTPPTPISITICGDGGCGKSSITLRLVRSQWTSDYDPTIEDSYSVSRRVDGAAYTLALTDTAGQEEYRGMWASSNLGADAFLLVYDITSRDSLDALQYFNDLIDMEAETRLDNAERARKAGLGGAGAADAKRRGAGAGPRMVPPVKIVAGNKCDLQQSRQVSAAVGLDWARRRGCGFMETSARLEVNIEETFALLPLTPLPQDDSAGTLGGGGGGGGAEKHRAGGMGGPRVTGERFGRGKGGFWKRLRCW